MNEKKQENNLPELENLDKKIQAVKNAIHAREGKEKDTPHVGYASRVAIELVSAVAVGGFIGWWLDRWFDTLPLFFVLCFMLGSVAGFVGIYRMTQDKDDTKEE